MNCCKCDAFITTRIDHFRRPLPAFCLPCLRQRPHASFGERLRAYRASRGMTQAELSKAVGIKQEQVSEYERDARQPGWRNVARLVQILGVDLILVPDPAPAKTAAAARRARSSGSKS
jgi:DNA-binding XRE family transcriptional regulator